MKVAPRTIIWRSNGPVPKPPAIGGNLQTASSDSNLLPAATGTCDCIFAFSTIGNRQPTTSRLFCRSSLRAATCTP